MANIDPARWCEISALLDDLLDAGPANRVSRLGELRQGDPALAQTVERLLGEAAKLDRERFLEGDPLGDVGVPSLEGMRIGAYTLARLIGQGGMGSVWLGRRSDGRFEGHAAIKLLNLALVGGGGADRFAREAAILSRLGHPNIARLLDAGVSTAGQPFLILEYVEGEAIDQYCDARNLDVKARIALFMEVASAVSHAHRNLVLHRDLKPSNILVDREGRVKLLDFGIAKLLQSAEAPSGAMTELTQLPGRAFTPEYAAPEQIEGDSVTTASDVYSLGVVFYELMSGRHPTSETSEAPTARIRALLEREPVRLSSVAQNTTEETARQRSQTPTQLAADLRGDLDNIAGKALKKIPGDRYASVDAFADDLRRFLSHQPVSARADTFGYRGAKFLRRHRVVVALGSMAAIALVLGLLGTISQSQRATREAGIAREQEARAETAARIASEQRDFALRELSRATASNDLNDFVLADAGASGRALTVGSLLERAVRMVEAQYGKDPANHAAMLVALGSRYAFLDDAANAKSLLARAYRDSRALDDRSVRAKAACGFAETVALEGNHAEAERLIREGLNDLPAEATYVPARLYCHSKGNAVARFALDGKVALAHAEQSRALLNSMPFASPGAAFQVAMDRGEAMRIAEQPREALAAYEEANAGLQKLGREGTETASTLYNNWGLVLDAIGRPREANQLFERAVRNSSEEGDVARVSPMLLVNYARTLRRLSELDEAARWNDRALQAARRTQHATIENQALLERVRIEAARGRVKDAQSALDEVEPRFRRVFAPTHPVLGVLDSLRAAIAQARDDQPSALDAYSQAIARFMAFRNDHPALARDLRGRAETLVALGRFGEALSDAERAIALYTRIVGPDFSSNLGAAYAVYARALYGLERDSDARQAIAAAIANLTPTLGEEHPETRDATALARAIDKPRVR